MSFSALVSAVDRAVQGHLGGVTVEYRPQYEEPFEIVGIFDERYVLVDPDRDGVEQVTPALFVRIEDLKIDPDEDEPTLIIDGRTYRVRESRSDGHGGVYLLLHRADLAEP